MSATLSEATGRPYGIQRVCQAWERSRSALYARQTREQQRHKGEEPARRGPTPTVSDATLLEAIQADLDRSPFQGEGHRKVHARLRILDGIRVARTRVLRVMRAHKLLSPHRGRQGAARVHAGTIVTQAPNVMWGTDGVRVFTLDDGWGWIFTAVEHWNAECVGWHVCKVGSRFAALEPIAQGLRRIYGALDADKGLTIRQGSAYLRRRSPCHARGADQLRGHVELLRCYYNFIRPHRALRFGRETRTPAMQAGLVSQRLALRDIFTAGGFTRRIFVAVVHVSVTVQPTESDEAELSTRCSPSARRQAA